ncbi:23S rRNA (uracil1939-C5)-methyltransferase [Breznakia sp. PF5-3]|uniref:23S rRNA (uracil(1939)-C(5))-methyltransferase RlmD n=1 Tax=unclassified Breznakia TaxID=2623764 RepID=UPI002406D562|nr:MULTISPECIES: 23S rRNA (uracil(1939)-C(5))-methyltransferase RlmD [unclassified Breznakia]MDF9824201.1 23S rRNA (uracil1939-C5)-methyltransferase [Breznakia sp. PM6-1]MDF9834999.1 23S rRNA (uracil1939-C5)-methyltransferase [Breznakia sp. PF5-3]MDF9837244.1 23S rRNA (uracil1939-C5)-methyltransferase [Breznakia sp. PFB2-8]MDF9859234.1 23S rRNA (uracil1939-C5)-methyltransferase [Breznakia sp. PH5-24]
MLRKDQMVNGEIEAIQPNGLGVFMYKKDKLFMKYVLKGEKVSGKVVKKIRDGYLAELVQVQKPSSIRTKVKCSYFQKCGSCNYLHMLYPFELKQKTEAVKQLANKGKININVHNCEGLEEPYAYRNKLALTFTKNRKNDVIAGFYEPLSHKVVNIDKCLLHDDATNTLIKDIKEVVKKCRLDIYDENKRTGFLRHVLVRENTDKKFMVTFITAEKEFKGKKKFLQELLNRNEHIEAVVQNINNRNTSVLLGNQEYVLYGKGYFYDTLCGLTFKISPKSFYQINHEQCEKLYDKALSLLDLKGDEVIVDTYCGIGTISLLAAQKAKRVMAVEVNKDAIKDANINRECNHIDNIEFFAQDAGAFMQKLASEKTMVDVVIIDPARDGCDENFLQALTKLKPKKIVYISCNPETQVRDLKYLSRQYTYKDMYLFDMFPKTSHVESVVLMTRDNQRRDL